MRGQNQYINSQHKYDEATLEPNSMEEQPQQKYTSRKK